MSLVEQAVRRPVGVAMLFIAITLLGLVSLVRLPVDLLPALAYPRLVVFTRYPAVGAVEVERLVTEPVERAVTGVPGVREVESVSREGESAVVLRFAWGADMDFAVLNTRERLDDVRGELPDFAERPVVLRSDPTAEPVMTLSVSGSRDLRSLTDVVEGTVRRRLEQVDGVAEAAVTGGVVREIRVEVDPAKLETQRLSIFDVSRALDAANQSAPAGVLMRGERQYPVRTLGELQSVRDIADVPIRRPSTVAEGGAGNGSVVVGDVARVRDDVREPDALSRFDGAPCVGILLYKEASANSVRVARAVEETLAELRLQHPDLRLAVATSQASFIEAAIRNVIQEIVFGGALALLALLLFLRDLRFSVAVALAIPISVVVSFALLDAAGVTLNLMSLGGLALGVGLLMDNSIVVLENIGRWRDGGATSEAAASGGTREIQRPVIASTATTIAVFGPVVYVEGVAGRLFAPLSAAVVFALSASTLVALLLLPAIAARWGPARNGPTAAPHGARVRFRAVDAFDRAFARSFEAYEHALLWALDHRGYVLIGASIACCATAALAWTLDRSLLPEVDEHAFRVRLALPRGTPLERTAAVATTLESRVRADHGVEAVLTRVGRQDVGGHLTIEESGPHVAVLDVRVRSTTSTESVVHRLAPVLRATGEVAEMTTRRGGGAPLDALVDRSESAIALRVYGDDVARTLAYARTLAARLARRSTLANVEVRTEPGEPELVLEVDRERAAARGADPAAIAATASAYLRGIVGTEFMDFDRRIPVVVRLPEELRRASDVLSTIRAEGVPLREFLRVRQEMGPTTIERIGQRRAVVVTIDPAGRDLATSVAEVQRVIAAFPAPRGARVEVGGAGEEVSRSFASLTLALTAAVLLVYLILAAEFESLAVPFVVLLSVPLGLMGSIIALWVTGGGINAVSLIGMVVLVGIVDNDAVMKIEFIETAVRNGMQPREAILAAGRARFRPIVMNTVTAAVGLVPMMLGIGAGAALQAPLAIALFGGLCSGTVLTLLVLPVVYTVVNDGRAHLRRRTITGGPASAPRTVALESGS
jgi:HAE1 family hydrophobic/amphiphilic exporter-1